MKPMKVYLAGPITSLSFAGCTDWRNNVASELNSFGIETLDPMRAKSFLAGEQEVKDRYDDHPLASAKGIMARDFWDCTRCDIVLVNFLGAKKISMGTVMEVAWAYYAGIPVVCCMEPENVHEHSMLGEAISFRVSTLPEAISIVKALK